MVNDAIPYYEDGDELTGLATAAVTGKRFVVISGNKPASGEAVAVAPAGAGAKALGVAMWDAAINKRVTVKTVNSGHCLPVTAGAGGVAAGDSVTSDATGAAVTAAGGARALGIALTAAAAGADAPISLCYHTA
jgi:hypothetical protein